MAYTSPILEKILSEITPKTREQRSQEAQQELENMTEADWVKIEAENLEEDIWKSHMHYGHNSRINEQIARGASSRAHILKNAY